MTDGAVCAKLNQFYAGSTYDKESWKREYFKAGAYYVASIYCKGRSKHDVKRGHMAVFGGNLRMIGIVDNRP